MRRGVVGALAASLVVTAWSALASAAPSTESVACASAYEQTQVLQKQGKFTAASQSAATCTQPACGAFIAKECGRFFDEITAATPSVVVAVTDPKGNDLTQAKVSIDGVVREKLDGSEIPIDPGTHVFHFEVPGLPPEERTYTLRAGEKLRRVAVTMGVDNTPPPPKPAPIEDTQRLPPPLPPPNPSVSSRSLKIGGAVVGVVGLLGVGTFGGLRWWAASDYNSMLASCKNLCAPSDVDAIHTKFVYSDVFLGVGIAAVSASAILLAVSFSKHDGPELRVAPSASGGMMAQMITSF